MEFTGALRYMLPWLTQDLDDIRNIFGSDCWLHLMPGDQLLSQYLLRQNKPQ